MKTRTFNPVKQRRKPTPWKRWRKPQPQRVNANDPATTSHDRHAQPKGSLGLNAVGLDVNYALADGRTTQRLYLDSAASTLQLGLARHVMDRFAPYYSNTHSRCHFGAHLCTREYEWAHEMMIDFVNADPDSYTAFFSGSGTTRGMNHLARVLSRSRPERDVVVTTVMEHHSNDLPHRLYGSRLIHVRSGASGTPDRTQGCVDLEQLARVLEEHSGRVNYVAVTGVSNVTGVINPIHDVAELAHRHGAYVLVDAAQMAAHMPICVSNPAQPQRDIDMLVFSGHKVYAPGSPGVVVAKKEIFHGVEPQEVGGGMVHDVSVDRYLAASALPDREEAGTPNISGAITLAGVLYALKQAGMDRIEAKEKRLVRYAVEKMRGLDGVVLYGPDDLDRCPRIGTVVFNLEGIAHSLTAAILNDYFNISVRNGCFCAHPYVRELITEKMSQHDETLSDDELESLADLHRGMVRVSFGLYNDQGDIDRLIEALTTVLADPQAYTRHYSRQPDGRYVHKTFQFTPSKYFCTRTTVDAWLNTNGHNN